MDEYQAVKELTEHFGIEYDSIHYNDLLNMFREDIEDSREYHKKNKFRFKYSDACLDVKGRFKEWYDYAKIGDYDRQFQNMSHFVASHRRCFSWIVLFAKGMYK